jgi:hypothetical protein
MARPKKIVEETQNTVLPKEENIDRGATIGGEVVVVEQKTTITPVSQVKLAVSIPGTTPQTLMSAQFDLDYDSAKQVLYIQKKGQKDLYVVHSSNVAYIKL